MAISSILVPWVGKGTLKKQVSDSTGIDLDSFGMVRETTNSENCGQNMCQIGTYSLRGFSFGYISQFFLLKIIQFLALLFLYI